MKLPTNSSASRCVSVSDTLSVSLGLGQATVADLPVAKQVLNNVERVLDLGADARLDRLHLLQPACEPAARSFLFDKGRVVPWLRLIAVIEPLYSSRCRVRLQPTGVSKMLRMYLLQQLYAAWLMKRSRTRSTTAKRCATWSAWMTNQRFGSCVAWAC